MGLALVVIEENARRPVHLGHDNPFRPVDHEGAVLRHHRHVAHVDELLLDIADRLGAGFLVDIPHDEPQGHLERRRVGHAALLALLHIEFRFFEFIADIFQHRPAGKVADRENRIENSLQPPLAPHVRIGVPLQKMLVRGFLDLDQVRHRRDFGNPPEALANAAAACEGLRHRISFSYTRYRGRDRPVRHFRLSDTLPDSAPGTATPDSFPMAQRRMGRGVRPRGLHGDSAFESAVRQAI